MATPVRPIPKSPSVSKPGGSEQEPVAETPRQRLLAGLSQMGFGIGKALILGGAMNDIANLVFNAAPSSLQAGSAWFGAAAFVLQMNFWFGGFLDLCAGVVRIAGRSLPDLPGDPLLAEHPVQTLQFWPILPIAAKNPNAAVLPALLLLPLIAGFSNGFSLCQLLWVGFYLLLFVATFTPVGALLKWIPCPLRIGLTLLFTLVSFVLLRSGDWNEAMRVWETMWHPSAATLQAQLLEVRLYNYLPLTLFALAAVTALRLPRVSMLMQQPTRLTLRSGLGIGFLSLLAASTRLPPSDNPVIGIPRHLVQTTLVHIFDAGNADVFFGANSWLYNPEEVSLHTGPVRSTATLDALESLARDLQKQQIPFLVISMPGKTALYPEGILPGYDRSPLQPAIRARAQERLRAAGADVLDLTDVFWKQREKLPAYLPQDDVWTPDVMKEAAVRAGRHIRARWPKLTSQDTPSINADIFDRTDAGELAHLLDPWAPDAYHPLVTSHILGIQGLDPSPESPVCFVGGSFAEVYDAPELSFGPESYDTSAKPYRAGFPAQLATQLARSLDVRTTLDPSPLNLLKEVQAELVAPLEKDEEAKKLVIYLLAPADFIPSPKP